MSNTRIAELLNEAGIAIVPDTKAESRTYLIMTETESRILSGLLEHYIEEIIGEMEQRETSDMSLKSWTIEDYKAFARNELRASQRQRFYQSNKGGSDG